MGVLPKGRKANTVCPECVQSVHYHLIQFSSPAVNTTFVTLVMFSFCWHHVNILLLSCIVLCLYYFAACTSGGLSNTTAPLMLNTKITMNLTRADTFLKIILKINWLFKPLFKQQLQTFPRSSFADVIIYFFRLFHVMVNWLFFGIRLFLQ